MNRPSVLEHIASIIHHRPLAWAIQRSVATALGCPFVHLGGGQTVWGVFQYALEAAIRDIEAHPRGKLFRRLIEYGPHHPDHPEALSSDGETTLSHPECGSCVEFISSHMVNRFKGEVAELLALEPCITLVQRLVQAGRLPADVQLYWGDMVQERRRSSPTAGACHGRWGGFTKGADGLLVEHRPSQPGHHDELLRVHGIVEVKSMHGSTRKVLAQMNRHTVRLGGGVKLGAREWSAEEISVASITHARPNASGVIYLLVMPSTWKLSRQWQSVKNEKGRALVLPEPAEPPTTTHIEALDRHGWKVTLAWSQEALNQAAYEMTFWYMSQVGAHVYRRKRLPTGWESMTPEQAGYNAIKMMLYSIPLRAISARQERLATRLYNVYGFGYPLGVDSKEMLWPQDFPDADEDHHGRTC